MSLAAPSLETTHCPVCQKNLQLIRASHIVTVNDKRYCSQTCANQDNENLERFKLSRAFGSRSPFKAQSKHAYR